MAALPYIQLYVADYLADTAHLTPSQHGAYLLLLMNYWQRGQPLNNKNERLSNVARMSAAEWEENKPILQEYFVINGDEWVHARVEADLAAVHAKSSKLSKAGKASAAKRNGATVAQESSSWSDENTAATDASIPAPMEEDISATNPVQAVVKSEAEPTQSSLIPESSPEQKAKGKRGRKPSVLIEENESFPEILNRKLVADWFALRKAKKLIVTDSAITGIAREAEKAGYTMEQALQKMCERGWGGFESAWVMNNNRPQFGQQQPAIERHVGLSEKNYHSGVSSDGKLTFKV